MALRRYKIALLYIGIVFFLNGCVPLLIGAGIRASVKAIKASNAKYKRSELETKEEYGKYRFEMQQKNIEPILSYDEWLKTQEKNSDKTSEKEIDE